MPGPKPPETPLSEPEREELETLIRARKTGQQIVFRARIILSLAEGRTTADVAALLETTRVTVRLWRQHWIDRRAASVVERLRDDPRSGAPQTFTAEQWCQLMALACEPPENSGRPISHWTPRELAEEAIKRKIVRSISTRHVSRFLTSGRVEAASESLLAQPVARPKGRNKDR
jgi:putative transposase